MKTDVCEANVLMIDLLASNTKREIGVNRRYYTDNVVVMYV